MAQEKNFENRVKAYLRGIGAWVLKYWGGAKFTKSGIPDLLVCYCGLFLGIELKSPRGHPDDLQLYQLKEIDKAGGIAILLYPKDFEQFKRLLADIEQCSIPQNIYDVYPFVKNAVDIENYLQAKERNGESYGKEN